MTQQAAWEPNATLIDSGARCFVTSAGDVEYWGQDGYLWILKGAPASLYRLDDEPAPPPVVKENLTTELPVRPFDPMKTKEGLTLGEAVEQAKRKAADGVDNSTPKVWLAYQREREGKN